MNTILLSIIIPFRASEDRPYLLERLENISIFLDKSDNVEYILVDSGSAENLKEQIKDICQRVGFHYLYHNSENKIYSSGGVRDYGAQHARGEIITFLDVDLAPPPNFSQHVLALAKRSGVMDTLEHFLIIPCLYLTEEGNNAFLEESKADRHKVFFQKYLLGDKEYIQNLAPCSSVTIVNRHHYLSMGGHRLEFEGHGYEDFELIHRLISIQNILPRAKYYYYDSKSWDDTTYEGFRSQFSILGQQALAEGLFTVHLWHPRPHTSGYEGNYTRNHANAIKFFKQFDASGLNPHPLMDLTKEGEGYTLFIGKAFSNVAECMREALPYLGSIIYASEDHLFDEKFDEEKIKTFLNNNRVNLIIFPNPYSNSIRLDLYNWVRKNKFSYYCFDRGALPDSWFFDPNGFNAASTSYDHNIWDKELSKKEKTEVKKYIATLLADNNQLEKQGSSIDIDSLRNSLNIDDDKKVLFVPFQRPNDTVIKHFSDIADSVDCFASIIDSIAKELIPHGWSVLCKKHPLEKSKPNLKCAKWVPDDTHFMDLLELSSAVALINSGVGVYAAIMGKPCYIFGNAFYQHPKINKKINDVSKVVNLILQEQDVCKETMYRFVFHLINQVYSFGRPKTHVFYEKNGGNKTITTGIRFYKLFVPNCIRIEYSEKELIKIPLNAPLFSSFLNDIANRDNKSTHSIAKLRSLISPYSIGILIFRIISRPFMNKNQASKLKRNPSAFFRDTKSPKVKKIGYLLGVVT